MMSRNDKQILSVDTGLVRKIAAAAKLSKTKLQAGEGGLTRLGPKAVQTHNKSESVCSNDVATLRSYRVTRALKSSADR